MFLTFLFFVIVPVANKVFLQRMLAWITNDSQVTLSSIRLGHIMIRKAKFDVK